MTEFSGAEVQIAVQLETPTLVHSGNATAANIQEGGGTSRGSTLGDGEVLDVLSLTEGVETSHLHHLLKNYVGRGPLMGYRFLRRVRRRGEEG